MACFITPRPTQHITVCLANDGNGGKHKTGAVHWTLGPNLPLGLRAWQLWEEVPRVACGPQPPRPESSLCYLLAMWFQVHGPDCASVLWEWRYMWSADDNPRYTLSFPASAESAALYDSDSQNDGRAGCALLPEDCTPQTQGCGTSSSSQAVNRGGPWGFCAFHCLFCWLATRGLQVSGGRSSTSLFHKFYRAETTTALPGPCYELQTLLCSVTGLSSCHHGLACSSLSSTSGKEYTCTHTQFMVRKLTIEKQIILPCSREMTDIVTRI